MSVDMHGARRILPFNRHLWSRHPSSSHLKGQLEHGSQQESADAVPLKAFIHRQPGKAQNGGRVSGQATAKRFHHRLCCEFST